MNALAEALGHWLADYYLLSTILLGVVLLAMLAMRQPVRKLALTRATIAGLTLLALLCALPDWSPVHLTGAAPPSPAGSSVELAKPEPTVDATATVEMRPAEVVVHGAEESAAVEPEARAPAAVVTVPAPSTNPLNITVLLGWVFLMGSVLFTAWFALGVWHLGRICRESERAPARVVSMLERIAGAVPLLPRLLLNGRLPSAVALGAWDTSILIPKQLAEGADEELTSVIAHEWAHVKNGDLRLLAASRWLMLLLWAHPLYWVLRVRMRLEQETLADAAAAEMTNRHDYAAHLVSWAKTMPAAPHPSLASAVGIWEGPSQLRRRIAVLLDEKLTVLRSCSRRWCWLAGSLCGLMAVALSLVTLRPASAQDDPVAAEKQADHAAAVSDDYQKFLGQWEVVSVAGEGGRFMDLDDKTKPGDQITIPHVHAPGPDFEGAGKVYQKSPAVTRWLNPEIERGWAKDDSLHLYPSASPSRCTYKSSDGEKPHFSDEANPPQYAIYRLEGDQLTLMIGDPADFKINQGQETNQSSAGTPVRWKWKFVVPNYPQNFDLDPGERQLLVKLKRVEVPGGAGDHSATATGLAGGSSGDVIREIYKETEAQRGKTLSAAQQRAQYRVWLARLQAELNRTKDPATRKSLSIMALGYSNGLGDLRTSETLLLELSELLEKDGTQSAKWDLELGGVYRHMAETGLAKVFNLERARDVFTGVIGKLESIPGGQSPDAYDRLVRTLAERGQVSEALHQESGDRKHLLAAADDYREARQQVDALAALAAAGTLPEDLEGGHGGAVRSYQVVLDWLAQLGYDAERFALQELSTCIGLGDDARARELLVSLIKSPGSDVRRDGQILKYARARYGIKTYPEFLKFLGERAAVEKVSLDFVTAIQKIDHAAAATLMLPGGPMAAMDQDAFEQEAGQLNEAYKKEPGRLLQIGESVIEGDWAAVRALAPTDEPKHSVFVVLKKTGGGWRVHSGDDFRFDEPLNEKLKNVIAAGRP